MTETRQDEEPEFSNETLAIACEGAADGLGGSEEEDFDAMMLRNAAKRLRASPPIGGAGNPLGWALWCDGEFSPEEVAWCNRDHPEEAKTVVEREKERFGMPESLRVIPLYAHPSPAQPNADESDEVADALQAIALERGVSQQALGDAGDDADAERWVRNVLALIAAQPNSGGK